MARRDRRAGKNKLPKVNIYIITEGTRTEIEYIERLKVLYRSDKFNFKIIKHTSSRNNPKRLVQRMLKKARENSKEFKGKDHYFIILDRDSWTDAHFQILQEWEAKNEKNHLIVSNVSFEYWLLLHFEEGNGVNSMD